MASKTNFECNRSCFHSYSFEEQAEEEAFPKHLLFGDERIAEIFIRACEEDFDDSDEGRSPREARRSQGLVDMPLSGERIGVGHPEEKKIPFVIEPDVHEESVEDRGSKTLTVLKEARILSQTIPMQGAAKEYLIQQAAFYGLDYCLINPRSSLRLFVQEFVVEYIKSRGFDSHGNLLFVMWTTAAALETIPLLLMDRREFAMAYRRSIEALSALDMMKEVLKSSSEEIAPEFSVEGINLHEINTLISTLKMSLENMKERLHARVILGDSKSLLFEDICPNKPKNPPEFIQPLVMKCLDTLCRKGPLSEEMFVAEISEKGVFYCNGNTVEEGFYFINASIAEYCRRSPSSNSVSQVTEITADVFSAISRDFLQKKKYGLALKMIHLSLDYTGYLLTEYDREQKQLSQEIKLIKSAPQRGKTVLAKRKKELRPLEARLKSLKTAVITVEQSRYELIKRRQSVILGLTLKQFQN